MSYIILCNLKLLSPKNLTHKHILNVEKGKRPQNPISNILYKKLVEKKITLKHLELNVDRDSIKGGSCEVSCSG